MRICIVADVHGNLAALDVVLADAQALGVEKYVCLGDVVGYGPHPGECLSRLRDLDCQILQGNHEAGLLRLPTRGRFNEYAEQAIEYTRRVLSEELTEYVAGFPAQVKMEEGLLFVHGSPFDRDEYLVYPHQVETILSSGTEWMTFCGHTHLQFVHDGDELLQGEQAGYALDPGRRYLVNPGSVGQPRDKDPRTAYAVVDLEAKTLDQIRLEYDIERTVADIQAAGLPEHSADRLKLGR